MTRTHSQAALLASLAIILLSTGCQRAEKPVVRERGHDPWVFRSVLDEQPRMLTVALAPKFWVAYDAQRAALYRIWQGGVHFDGAVYTAQHGPQPLSLGTASLVSTVQQPWRVVRDGKEVPAVVRYRGHRFERGQVQLMYSIGLDDGNVIEIEERPEAFAMADGTLGLERVFTTGKAPGDVQVLMDFNAVALDSEQDVRIRSREDNLVGELTLRANGTTRLLMHFPTPPAVAVDPVKPQVSRPVQLIATGDCVACHNPVVRTIGPSYKEVAERYRTNEQTIAGIARRILEGGGGDWGNATMVAHATMAPEDAAAIAKHILTTYDPEDSQGTVASHPLGPQDEAEGEDEGEESVAAEAAPAGIPGDRRPLDAVHPSFRLSSMRPQSFKPMVGGIDFLPDGRMLVSTWDARGSVYVLGNLQQPDPEKFTVKEIASGLMEPLGLKVVDGVPYVLQKHELTKLIDTDGDDVVDEYRTLTDAWGVSANFHTFAFGLAYRDGFLYGTLATSIEPGGASSHPQIQDRGKVMKIDRNTGAIEYVAKGLRTPNGIGPGVDDELFVADNQGDWLPANKIVRVESGAFYGSYSVDPVGTKDTPVTAPLVWLPQDEIANSPSQPLRIDFGPYKNQMLYGDVTHGGLNRIVTQKIGGHYQGCVIPFTQGLEAGINRAIIGPDGAIYLGGIGNPGNWSHEGKLWYGLQRLEYTGAPTFEMLDVQMRSDGIEISFTEPMRLGDGDAAADYEVKQWHYVPTAEYGGPKVGEHVLAIKAAHVSPDRRRVFLDVGGIKPGHMIYVRLASPMVAQSNRELWATETWCTVNAVPKDTPGERFGGAVKTEHNTLTDAQMAAGWRSLFDGRTVNGWRSYGGKPLNPQWRAREGALSLPPGGGGGDIVTEEEFGDFELELEWQIARGGNSGVFYRVNEAVSEIWQAAPEMQVLDDERHDDRLTPTHRAGAAYDLYVPRPGAVRPAGEYNQARLVVRGTRVEHWLNGRKIIAYDTAGTEWKQRLAASKFSEFPQFATAARGRIGLQDHGDAVRFRNIRIRPL